MTIIYAKHASNFLANKQSYLEKSFPQCRDPRRLTNLSFVFFYI